MKFLSCQNSRSLTNIGDTANLSWYHCSGCIWSYVRNDKFDDNIRRLIVLQRWFKKILQSKRLTKLIPKLIPLYYHPECKGGYFHKKSILEFLSIISIKN